MKTLFRKSMAIILTIAMLLSVMGAAASVLSVSAATYPELILDEEATARIRRGGGTYTFAFTPSETGVYTFYAESDEIDTMASLYDSDFALIFENDDGGWDLNFSISYTLVAGNTYYLETYLYDEYETASFSVYVIEGPEIEDITFEPITMYDGLDGEWYEEYDDNDEYIGDYYRYAWWHYVNYTITFKDGTAYESDELEFEYNDIWYELTFDRYVQSIDNQWTGGNTYTQKIGFAGVEYDVDVIIEESPIAKIEFEPISLGEYTTGYYDYDYDDETDSETDLYFRYYLPDYFEYTITMKNGDVIEGYDYGFYYNDIWYEFDYYTNQSYENRWLKGGKYTVDVLVGSMSAPLEVLITESPIKSIKAEPVTIIENTEGYWDYWYDDDDEEVEYFWYDWIEVCEYTITMKNGDVIQSTDDYFYYDNIEYCVNYTDSQTYNKSWKKGKTYTETISCGGKEAKVSISIVENPIKEIEFNPITLGVHSTGDWNYEYDDEYDEEYEFFVYDWWNYLTYTITMKNGDVVKGSGTECEYKNYKFDFYCDDDQYYGNEWTKGNTYTAYVEMLGFESEVDITIAAAGVAKDYEGTWYYYKNGEKVNTTGLTKINGEWYYLNRGVWDPTMQKLHKINGKWFYITEGKWTATTGLVKYQGKWFYVSGGKWNSNVTDLKKVNGKWFYIQNGKWNNTIDTLHKINGKWFLIKGGKWNKTTGLVEYKGKTFLVKGGKWDSSVNTLYKKDGKFYAIKNGKVYTGKAIITYNGKKFYVNNGYAQLSFSGRVKIGSKTYTIKSGKVV